VGTVTGSISEAVPFGLGVSRGPFSRAEVTYTTKCLDGHGFRTKRGGQGSNGQTFGGVCQENAVMCVRLLTYVSTVGRSKMWAALTFLCILRPNCDIK